MQDASTRWNRQLTATAHHDISVIYIYIFLLQCFLELIILGSIEYRPYVHDPCHYFHTTS